MAAEIDGFGHGCAGADEAEVQRSGDLEQDCKSGAIHMLPYFAAKRLSIGRMTLKTKGG